MEQDIEFAAIWARHIQDSRKRGENMDESQRDLISYMVEKSLHTFLVVDYKALEKQL